LAIENQIDSKDFVNIVPKDPTSDDSQNKNNKVISAELDFKSQTKENHTECYTTLRLKKLNSGKTLFRQSLKSPHLIEASNDADEESIFLEDFSHLTG